jgi:hypothetical protein
VLFHRKVIWWFHTMLNILFVNAAVIGQAFHRIVGVETG